jgi:hypothetical protein
MPVSFERDIRLTSEQIDIDHRNEHKVLLDDYTRVSDPSSGHGTAQAVEHRLKNRSMPPGGPYSGNEQLILYER